MIGGLLGIFFLSSFASLGAVSSVMDHNSPKLEAIKNVYNPQNGYTNYDDFDLVYQDNDIFHLTIGNQIYHHQSYSDILSALTLSSGQTFVPINYYYDDGYFYYDSTQFGFYNESGGLFCSYGSDGNFYSATNNVEFINFDITFGGLVNNNSTWSRSELQKVFKFLVVNYGDNSFRQRDIAFEDNFIFAQYFNNTVYENTFFLYNRTALNKPNPIDVYRGWFTSSGEIFNKISITTITNLSGLSWAVYNGSQGDYASGDIHTGYGDNINYSYIAYVSYINTYTNVERVVFLPRHGSNSNESTNYLLLNSYYWVNYNYSRIHLYNIDYNSKSSLPNCNNRDWLSALQLRVNLSNISDDNNFYITNGITLINTAFGGLTRLFAIAILPGITIGTLLFLPLLATIIVVLIKFLKK